MSNEAGSSQPPTGSGDKPQQAKLLASYTSFINKGSSTRKFAPKVARRRPGAAAAPQTPPVETAPVTSDSQAEQSQSSSQPAAESERAQQIAGSETTPAQEAVQSLSHDTLPQAQSPVTTPLPPTPAETANALSPTETSISQSQDTAADQQHDECTTTNAPSAKRPIENEEAGPEPKRQRIDSQRQEPSGSNAQSCDLGSATASPIINESTTSQNAPIQPTELKATGEQTVDASNQVLHIAVSSTEHPTAGQDHTSTENTPHDDSQQHGSVEGRRKLPWAAVNRPERVEESNVNTDSASIGTTTAKGKRKATASETVVRNVAPRSTKVKCKQNATIPEHVERSDSITNEGEAEGTSGLFNARRPRKVRKDKGAKRKSYTRAQNTEENQEATQTGRPKRKRTSKAAARVANEGEREDSARASGADSDAEDQEEGRLKKKPRGRASTPLDAEDQEIDPDDVCMDDLASRNIRVGKLSEREKAMRSINWDEIRQRRREEMEKRAEELTSNQDEVNEALDKAGQERDAQSSRRTGPQFTTTAEGDIVMQQDSMVIDRQADATHDLDQLQTVEEDDLTKSINTASFMRSNRRDPAARAGRAHKWTAEATQQFYDALRMFGTDFQMISTLFPGSNRRSIKNKFVKEERANPALVKAYLDGTVERNPVDWDTYLTLSGKDADSFIDPEELERELAEKNEHRKILIEQVKAEWEEEQRQRQLAGLDDDEDEEVEHEQPEESAKENRGRRKKERQNPPKHMPGGGEVEILGDA